MTEIFVYFDCILFQCFLCSEYEELSARGRELANCFIGVYLFIYIYRNAVATQNSSGKCVRLAIYT